MKLAYPRLFGTTIRLPRQHLTVPNLTKTYFVVGVVPSRLRSCYWKKACKNLRDESQSNTIILVLWSVVENNDVFFRLAMNKKAVVSAGKISCGPMLFMIVPYSINITCLAKHTLGMPFSCCWEMACEIGDESSSITKHSGHSLVAASRILASPK